MRMNLMGMCLTAMDICQRYAWLSFTESLIHLLASNINLGILTRTKFSQS